MEQELDWRHWIGVGVAVLALVFVGWKIVNRPAAQPNAAVQAGSNARSQDAPDTVPNGQPAQPAAGLPTGIAR